MKKDLEKQYIKSMGNFFLTLWLGWLGIHRFIKKLFDPKNILNPDKIF